MELSRKLGEFPRGGHIKAQYTLYIDKPGLYVAHTLLTSIPLAPLRFSRHGSSEAFAIWLSWISLGVLTLSLVCFFISSWPLEQVSLDLLELCLQGQHKSIGLVH